MVLPTNAIQSSVQEGTTHLLESLLHERDIPCPLCGYNLRNLKSDRCPECGGGLKVQVGLTEPRLMTYIALLVACCVGLGGSVLFTLVALANAPGDWWNKTAAKILLSLLFVTATLLPIILACRSRFRRARPSHQRAMALGLWGLVGSLSLAFIFLFKG